MDILRVPPYNLSVSIDVALAATEYDYQIVDMADSSVLEGTVTSSSDSKVVIDVPSKYDGDYEIIIDGDETQVTVIRPYSNPNDHGTTASEIAEYASNEELARAIIDSVNDVEFTYRKKVLEVVGLGLDYIPLWIDAKKILKVYENNVLVYDAENPDDYATAYEITADGTAITMSYPEAVNRDESARLLLPASPTDIVEFNYAPRGFPKGWDYKIVVEHGFKKVPSDIKRAAELLIHDIECGKLDYYKRYVGSYNTDQFRIQFDKGVFEGTGNLIVDKILSKYEKSIKFVGVL
jgi:hypothetical protein